LNNKVLIIAGEASGDLHGSSLIEEMKKINKNIEPFGIGGDKMLDAGLEAIYHIKDMAFLGFAEVIKHLPFIKKVQKNILDEVEKRNIKLAVLIDYPGFNLSIAKKLKKRGVEIIYYISPQIWAWGKGRIKKIKRLVDKMLVIFPFEEELYKSHGVNCTYVGHPLIAQLKNYEFLSKEELFKKFNLDVNKEILLIMPGSRKQEIENIFTQALAAAEKITEKYNLQTVIACAQNLNETIFGLNANNNNKVIKGNTYELLKYSKIGIIKSGTSTLEAGIFSLPSVVIYATSTVTYFIARSLVKIKNIALANIVAGETIFEELIQKQVNPNSIFQASAALLDNNNRYNSIKNRLAIIKEKLGNLNASKNAADIILNRLNEV
jgi:lipid-A-disaccharide synthase